MKKEIVETIVKKCLGHKKNEHMLIVTDDKLKGLACEFYKVTRLLKIESVLIEIKPRRMHGQEPPAAVAAALKEADSAVLLTSMSLSHTHARKEASSRYGTRIASLPGATQDMLERAIPIDYALLKRNAVRLASVLTKAKSVEVYTKRGTELVMSIRGRKAFADNGLYTRKGAFGNLPAGEVCIGPCEGTANGRLVVDGSMPLTGRLKHPIEIIIKNGYAQNIPVPEMAPLVKSLGKCSLNVAELGVGLNPKAKLTGIVLEDEKVIGTAHVALGDNRSFGGKVSCRSHLDFVFFNPTILADGEKLEIG